MIIAAMIAKIEGQAELVPALNLQQELCFVGSFRFLYIANYQDLIFVCGSTVRCRGAMTVEVTLLTLLYNMGTLPTELLTLML